MANDSEKSERVFKTAAWFTKAARKAHIPDEELCSYPTSDAGARRQPGPAAYSRNGCARISTAPSFWRERGRYWVYEYLFAKQDRANIEDDELADFRKLVKAYAGLTAHQVNQLIRENHRMEICNGNQA